jgi:hypothetical protein
MNLFRVDNERCETTESSLTAMEIKELAHVPASYQLAVAEDDAPDRILRDDEAVDLTTGKRQFYAFPQATFAG